MKTLYLILTLLLTFSSCTFQPRATWVVTTERNTWQEQPDLLSALADTIETIDATIYPDKQLQVIEGFGACFNELGWISLSRLDPKDREEIMEELFFPEFGANFSICCMPMGANDFSRNWYSYNETDGDFEMNNFTIANDQQTLIPYLKNALKYDPDLRIWASPWCPPSWMKSNKQYALDMLVQDSVYLQAYALYFSRFITAYREQGINIFAVMPQYECDSARMSPGCCWTTASLINFVGSYLEPAMKEQNVQIMFDTTKCTSGEKACRIEQKYGNGKNDWKGAVHFWNLMRYSLNNGVSSYLYNNISLEKGGFSPWGWAQNSLVVVDPANKSYQYTYEYYMMKHLSHYVQPGANKVETSGTFTSLMAFVNPDKSVVVALANESNDDRIMSIQIGDRVYQPSVPAHSIATLQID